MSSLPSHSSDTESPFEDWEPEDSGDSSYPGGFVEDQFLAFEQHLLTRGFREIGYGSFRRTFKRGKVVIKVPRCNDGANDNRVEAAAYRKYKNGPTSQGIFMAPCRILSNYCLMMVHVEGAYLYADEDDGKKVPHWAKLVEGRQCGYYHGRLVAYDFALDISEREEWEKSWGVRSEFYHR